MQENQLVIHHPKNVQEIFAITNAKYNLYQVDDIWEFALYFKTSKAITRAPALEEVIDAKPNFEATAILPGDALNLETGKVIIQKQGYDDERDEHLSNFYYFEHESIEDLEIELLEVHKEFIKVQVKGKTYVNSYVSKTPDTELFIASGVFMLDPNFKRGIS